ncbi:MAG: platelet-activating factor acetylhydrolase IB subunit [Planctomycetota bacterium]|jgi:beta-glucosidase
MNTLLTGILTWCFVLSGCTSVKTHSAVTPVPRTDEWWVKRHESFNARAQQGNVDLVFIGNSITHSWENAGKEIWSKYYGHRRAMNLGISGDRTQHVLWRLDHGNIDGISPKVAVLMIGTNNSNGTDNMAEEIADGITAIVKRLTSKLPRTRVLILGIFPRGEKPDPQREKNTRASQMVMKLADDQTVYYIDIGEHFLQPDGTLTKEIMPDYLHLTSWGYQIWAIAIEGKLRELLGEKP